MSLVCRRRKRSVIPPRSESQSTNCCKHKATVLKSAWKKLWSQGHEKITIAMFNGARFQWTCSITLCAFMHDARVPWQLICAYRSTALCRLNFGIIHQLMDCLMKRVMFTKQHKAFGHCLVNWTLGANENIRTLIKRVQCAKYQLMLPSFWRKI